MCLSIFLKKKIKILISFSKHHKMITWYINYILGQVKLFSDHTCRHHNHTKYDFCKDFWNKQFLPYVTNYNRYHHHLWQRVRHLHRHNRCKIVCNCTTENLNYWDFFAFVDIFISEIINMKTLKINVKFTFNVHIWRVYWCWEVCPS